MDRTRTIARWLIDLEVDGAGTGLGHEGIDHFESPVLDTRIVDEELIGAGEVNRIPTSRRKNNQK